MTINTENPSKMVLQNNKQMAFLSLFGMIGIGLLIVCLLARHGVVPILVGLAFMGGATFMLFKLRRVTIELDKACGTIHILLQGLRSKEERNLGMAEVEKLFLRKVVQTTTVRTSAPAGARYGAGHSTSSTTTYHQFILVFVTRQNEEIPFDFGKVKVGLMNFLTTPEEKIRRQAQQVAEFLNVPLSVATPPSASDVLGAIRKGLSAKLQKVH